MVIDLRFCNISLEWGVLTFRNIDNLTDWFGGAGILILSHKLPWPVDSE